MFFQILRSSKSSIKKLVAYLAGNDPTFLTRNVGRQRRGVDERIACSNRLRPTDNSPAWWIHHHLFNLKTPVLDDFPAAIESIPCEMFRVKLPETINSAGWHVAHIYDVKNGDTDYMNWSAEELIKRTVRNIHPCNYFYIPKTDWKIHGGQAEVLSFFQSKYATLYAAVWDEFLQLAQATPYERIIDARSYVFATSSREKQSRKLIFNGVECAVSYEYSQLCFNAKWIEPLEMNQRFCVVTPNLYFIMTKKTVLRKLPKYRARRKLLPEHRSLSLSVAPATRPPLHDRTKLSMKQSKKAGRTRFGILDGIAIGLFVVTLFGYLGRFHWFFDLFSHFRVQYLQLCLIPFIIALWKRRNTLAIALVLLVCLNYTFVLPLYFGKPGPAKSKPIRAMLMNINAENSDAEQVLKAIEMADPDWVLLEEVTPRWAQELEGLHATYRYRIAQPQDGCFGMILFSKYPLEHRQIVEIGTAGVPSIIADVYLPNGVISVIGTHPLPPVGADHSSNGIINWRLCQKS